MQNGDLATYLQDSRKELTEQLILNWFKGIASGMLHLTLEGIVHRDLAARNVLLSQRLEAKVSDFGMSRQLETNQQQEGAQTQTGLGPVKWMPPESLLDLKYSEKSDVW